VTAEETFRSLKLFTREAQEVLITTIRQSPPQADAPLAQTIHQSPPQADLSAEPFGGCAFRQKNGGQAGANHSRINQSTNSLIKRELP
jgi:hypothetical protein